MRRMLERWMARFLKKRGWVVFYLDPVARHCSPANGICWLNLWQQQETQDEIDRIKRDMMPGLRGLVER